MMIKRKLAIRIRQLKALRSVAFDCLSKKSLNKDKLLTQFYNKVIEVTNVLSSNTGDSLKRLCADVKGFKELHEDINPDAKEHLLSQFVKNTLYVLQFRVILRY